jgi:hypothetical protein
MVAGPPCLRGPCALVALVMVETGVARVCIGSSHIDKTIFCFWQRQCHNDVVTDVVPDPFRAVTTSLYLLTTLVVPTDKTILCFWQRQCQTSAAHSLVLSRSNSPNTPWVCPSCGAVRWASAAHPGHQFGLLKKIN